MQGTRTTIGPQLRKQRLAAGLTQGQLAEAAGIADATVSRIERGRLVPTIALVQRLASALRCSVDELLHAKAGARQRGPRPCEARLLAAVRDMDDAAVDDVVRGIKLVMGAVRRSKASRG